MNKIKKPKTTLQKIRLILEKDPSAHYRLDEAVDFQASEMARAINNDGLSPQLEFLNQRGISDEKVLADLEGIFGRAE